MKLPNKINCALARDKLDKHPIYSADRITEKRFKAIKNSISQVNILDYEYYSEYLYSLKNRGTNKILLIEDRDKNRDYLCSILQSANFEVIEAKDSKTAIKLAYSEVPDLIICELLMPIISGYGVIASLCHSTVTSEIPFLFMTAHLEQSDGSKILSIFDLETVEPLTKEKLLEAVSDRLGIAIDRR